MFQWLVNLEVWLKGFWNNLVFFYDSNTSLIGKIFFTWFVVLPIIWIMPILDIIGDVFIVVFKKTLKYTRIIFKSFKTAFKIIFNIKPKIFYYHKDNMRICYKADENGKLEFIGMMPIPTEKSNPSHFLK